MMRSFLLLLSSLLSVSCGALESDVKQHKAPPVILKASIDQSLILPYQQLKLHLIGENKGRVNTTFNDPYTVPNAMALTLVSNARTESTLVSTARNDAPNNIALLPRKVSISPAKPFRFSIDLQKYFQLSRPGNYALSINYEWQDGKVWQSPEYHFEISSTSVSYLAGTANESGQTGYHGVYWLNQSKSGSTLLVKPWRIQDHDFTLGGANAYFGVPNNTDISLSMQPAHDPMLDRWLVTLSKTSLAARYLSDQKDLELTTSTEVPESLSLIKPALASLSPDEGDQM